MFMPTIFGNPGQELQLKFGKTAKAAARDRCNKCMVLHVENAALLYHSLKQACAAGALVQDPLMEALMQDPMKMQGSRSAQKLVLYI
jgi:hypothetical protein